LSEGSDERKRVPCNNCGIATNHILRARYSTTIHVHHGLESDDGSEGDVHGKEGRYSTWMCAGCNSVTFQYSYMEEVQDGYYDENIAFFPTLEVRSKYFRNLNTKLSSLYSEVFACFQKGSLLLCTIGLRALIEGVCRDKGLTEGNLEDKVNGLVRFLPSLNIIETLHALRFAGNDAAHELEALSREDAGLAIEIVEDLLNYLYDLDYKATQIRSRSKTAALNSIKPGPVQ